jgi:protein-arginine kinase activator protein McsA
MKLKRFNEIKLNDFMKLAVDNEDFEKAAQIRDLIKSFNK